MPQACCWGPVGPGSHFCLLAVALPGQPQTTFLLGVLTLSSLNSSLFLIMKWALTETHKKSDTETRVLREESWVATSASAATGQVQLLFFSPKAVSITLTEPQSVDLQGPVFPFSNKLWYFLDGEQKKQNLPSCPSLVHPSAPECWLPVPRIRAFLQNRQGEVRTMVT